MKSFVRELWFTVPTRRALINIPPQKWKSNAIVTKKLKTLFAFLVFKCLPAQEEQIS